MPLIDAFDATTGVHRWVPGHWIDHPVLGANLTTTPPGSTPPSSSTTPTPSRTRVRRPAGDSPATTDTPASGDEKELIPDATDPR